MVDSSECLNVFKMGAADLIEQQSTRPQIEMQDVGGDGV
jgi:hypothetical protein